MMSSVCYHDIFNYPLTKEEIIKWKCNTSINPLRQGFVGQASKNGYYFLKNRESLIKQRQDREKISARKLEIAKKAAEILSKIPNIKMVAVTGSLAMMNSSEESDIDLLIITRQNTLWLSRLLVLVIFFLLDIPVRRSDDSSQKDKLCLNMWLDESDLVWSKKDRNIYTAHEIAQIVPLVNKDKTYEKFLYQNKWILDFWPNSVKIGKLRGSEPWKFNEKLRDPRSWKLEIGKFKFVEKICYWIQYNYMRTKITRETVSETRALFHPHDWGKVVLKKLSS